jgi:hypothetical protein
MALRKDKRHGQLVESCTRLTLRPVLQTYTGHETQPTGRPSIHCSRNCFLLQARSVASIGQWQHNRSVPQITSGIGTDSLEAG